MPSQQFLTTLQKLFSTIAAAKKKQPLEQDTSYDPNSISPIVRPTTPPIAGLEIRPRYATGEPDQLTKLKQEGDWIAGGENHGRGGSTIEKPGRLKAGLLNALSGVGQLARQNMASGRTSWADVAGLGGVAAGGFGGGVANPNSIVKARHQQAVEENARDQAAELERENARSIINSRRANDSYKATLPEKAQRDQELRQADIDRKQAYQDESLRIRNDALEGKLSYQDWQKQQKELDRKFNEEKFDETKRHNQVGERISQQNANTSQNRARSVTGNAGASQAQIEANSKEIADLLEQDKHEATYNPIIDKTTGQPATNERGEILYGNTPTRQYTDRHKRVAALQRDNAKLQGEVRKTSSAAGTSAAPKGQTFSISKWKAANPQGDANAAAAKARKLGYTVAQ